MVNNKVNEFLNENFGTVRTITKDEEIWFVAKDICGILGLNNISKALENHREEKDKCVIRICDITNSDTTSKSRKTQDMLCINEQGLYKLIFKSRKPFAEEFQDWLCEEVIPSIRKDGMYINREEEMESQEELIKATEQALEQKLMRKFGKSIRRDFTKTIEDNWEVKNKMQFATYTDQLVNIPVLGLKASTYKKENNIPKSKLLRDYLETEELEHIAKQEQDVATLVHYGLDYYKVKELVNKH